jgi:uncharacterized membrane protein HdeD (DUF308 family)
LAAQGLSGTRAFSGWWWFLVTGITWLTVSLILFRFDASSIATVGILLGLLLITAGASELVVSATGGGLRWFHIILGVLLVVGGIWCLVRPIGGAVELASILGFLLLFKGSLYLIGSIMSREVAELWWLGAIIGFLEILLAFWISQSFIQTRVTLLVLWAGFMAIFRGFTDIVLALELRATARAVSPV